MAPDWKAIFYLALGLAASDGKHPFVFGLAALTAFVMYGLRAEVALDPPKEG